MVEMWLTSMASGVEPTGGLCVAPMVPGRVRPKGREDVFWEPGVRMIMWAGGVTSVLSWGSWPGRSD